MPIFVLRMVCAVARCLTLVRASHRREDGIIPFLRQGWLRIVYITTPLPGMVILKRENKKYLSIASHYCFYPGGKLQVCLAMGHEWSLALFLAGKDAKNGKRGFRGHFSSPRIITIILPINILF